MDRHICKQCGEPYNYCRACLISPIPYKAAGFCSKECSAKFKASQKEVKVKSVKEDILPQEVQLIVEEIHEEVIAADEVTLIEEVTPIDETPIIIESTMNKETYNANKKNKKHK